jgi:hypothetical protein
MLGLEPVTGKLPNGRELSELSPEQFGALAGKLINN